jgi:hypothetical protein
MAVLLVLQSPAPKQTGVQVWPLIVGASVIATLLGAAIGIASTITRYRLRRVEQRVYEIAEAQLGAEDAEGKLRRLTQLNQALEDQLSKVPLEANRLFLARRMEQLSTSISRDFHEYVSIEQQLKPKIIEPRLDPLIREAIEQAIVPLQKRRDRQTIYIVVLLLALIALTLSPIQPNYLAWRYFNALDYSWNWTPDSPAWMIGIGGLIVAFIISAASSLSTRSYALVARLRRSKIVILGLTAALVVLIALGYYCRYNITTCAPLSCDQAGISTPYDPAGIFFNFATLAAGCLFVVILGLGRKLKIRGFPKSGGERGIRTREDA